MIATYERPAEPQSPPSESHPLRADGQVRCPNCAANSDQGHDGWRPARQYQRFFRETKYADWTTDVLRCRECRHLFALKD